MRSKCLLAALVIWSCCLGAGANAETLAELVKREEGLELGLCVLTPKPDVAGTQTYVVIPARFANPGIWVTRSILFVGVDDGNNVVGITEARALHDIPPREVVSVSCNRNALTIRMSSRMSPATLSYVWDGKQLKRK
jgi:hypothetical protein